MAPKSRKTGQAREPREAGRQAASAETSHVFAVPRILRMLALLAPLVAGAGVGALINKALVFAELAQRFWPGAVIEPARAPGQGAVNLAAIAGALLLWAAIAASTRGKSSVEEAMERASTPFLPALPLLVLAAIDNSGMYPGIMIYALHAAIFAVGGFIAATVALVVASHRPDAVQTLPRTPSTPSSTPSSTTVWTMLVLAAAYAVTFTTLGFLQYDALNISYTDTADWEQMLYNTLHGRFLETTAFPHMFFGEHVQFNLLFLLPFYALFPSLKTLMLLKSVALASGAVPVYLVAAKRLKARWAGVAFAAAYLLYPPMQYLDLELTANTFRPEILGVPALLWAVWFLESQNLLGLAIAAFFAVAAKEEFALPVAMLGVLLALQGRRKAGAAFLAAGLVWFVVCVFVVIPYFREGPSHMGRYYQDFWSRDAAGNLVETTLSGIILNVVKNPFHALAVALQPTKIDYLLMLVVPLGLLPIFSWRMLLVMLPSLATTLLASREPSFLIYYHYQAALVPFLVMGAVYGAEAILRRAGAVTSNGRAALAGLAALALASSLAGNVVLAKSPISLLFYNPRMETYWRRAYVQTPKAEFFFAKVQPLVPKEVSVSATEFAATYFAARKDDYIFPDGVGKAEYVVVDTRDPWLPMKMNDMQSSLDAELAKVAAAGYEKTFEGEGFLVYRKANAGVP